MADAAELARAHGSGPCSRRGVEVQALSSAPLALELQEALFERSTNLWGSQLVQVLPPAWSHSAPIDVRRGIVDSWHVVHVEASGAFWALWRDLWFGPDLFSPYPFDLWGTAHLARFLDWQFEDGRIWLQEAHGRVLRIEYLDPCGQAAADWEAFQSHKKRQAGYRTIMQDQLVSAIHAAVSVTMAGPAASPTAAASS